jgi:hypothetical protein
MRLNGPKGFPQKADIGLKLSASGVPQGSLD